MRVDVEQAVVPQVSWERMLAAVPVRNAAATVTRTQRGTVNVQVKGDPMPLLKPIYRLLKVAVQRTVVLDRLGTEMWELCDDRRTVEEVVDIFAGRHRLTFHESRVAVTNYLKQLVQRGVLAMAMDRKMRRNA